MSERIDLGRGLSRPSLNLALQILILYPDGIRLLVEH